MIMTANVWVDKRQGDTHKQTVWPQIDPPYTHPQTQDSQTKTNRQVDDKEQRGAASLTSTLMNPFVGICALSCIHSYFWSFVLLTDGNP